MNHPMICAHILLVPKFSMPFAIWPTECLVSAPSAVLLSRMVDVQKPATTIKIGANDPLYMSFLPALDTAMIAAWHQPKVPAECGRFQPCLPFMRFESSTLCLFLQSQQSPFRLFQRKKLKVENMLRNSF